MSTPSKTSKKKTHLTTVPGTITHQIPSNNRSSPLCKTLIVVLLLLAIPLFPSQPPDGFISHQLWEIIHLLFIGIAVSYGLFSRKTGSETPNCDGDDAYLSGISHLSSVFEDGFGNVCASDVQDDSVAVDRVGGVGSGGSRRLEGKDSVFSPKLGSFRELGGEVERVGRAWRSQYSKGESMIVVSNGECFVYEAADFKPLNLPVRSLTSRVADDSDKTELKCGGRCSPKLEAKGRGDGGGPKVVKIRDATPMKLEKLEEVSELSPIPWRSRSLRMVENGERVSRNSKTHGHYRPYSVGEFDFKHLNKSSSPRGLMFSNSPELLTSSRMASTEGKKDKGEPNFSVSNPKKGTLEAEASLGGTKTRPYSDGLSSEMTVLRNVECDLKHGGEEDEAVKGKRASDSFGSDVKSPGLAKVLSRAKSVRTIKPSKYFMDGKEQGVSEIDSKLGRTSHKLSTSSWLTRGERREEPGNDAPVNSQNQESDSHIFPMEFHHTGKEEGGIDNDHCTTDQSKEEKEEEDIESEADRSAFEDNVKRDNVDISDAELGSEVDRKAGEFIAKFREQIRLQKMSSVRGHGGWQQI